jgi:hypothetical protein
MYNSKYASSKQILFCSLQKSCSCPIVWGESWAILYVHGSEIVSQLHQPNPLLHISSNLLLIIVFICNVITTVLPWKMICCLPNISEMMLGEMTRNLLSRPLLRLTYGEYWFRLSRLFMMVIGSFASYTKTKSVESAV